MSAIAASRSCTAVRAAAPCAQKLRASTSKAFSGAVSFRTAARNVRASRQQIAAPTQALFNFGTKTEEATGAYAFTVKDAKGKNIKMSQYKGKVVLVVNVASECGFTPQYAGLADLYNKYQSKGLVVLGFPCNQFGAQEPGSAGEIQSCAVGYGAKFPLMEKIEVNGSNADPFFTYLKENSPKGFLGMGGGDVQWNFGKFLLDREGNVVKRTGSMTTPESLEKEILALL